MTTSFESGAQVETSMFGYESVIGVSALMGTKHSLNRIFMQLSGYGYACSVRSALEEFRRNGIFQHLALRYVQAQLTLSTQNAACNAMLPTNSDSLGGFSSAVIVPSRSILKWHRSS